MWFQFRESEVPFLFVSMAVFFFLDKGSCNSINITSDPPPNSEGVLYYCASQGRPCTITCSFNSQTPDPEVVVNGVAYSVTDLRNEALYHNVSSRNGRLTFTFQLDYSMNTYNYSCMRNGGTSSRLIVLKNDVSQCTSQTALDTLAIVPNSTMVMVSTVTRESDQMSSSVVTDFPNTSGGQGTGLVPGVIAVIVLAVIAVLVVVVVVTLIVVFFRLCTRMKLKNYADQPISAQYFNLTESSSTIPISHISGTEDQGGGDTGKSTTSNPDGESGGSLVAGNGNRTRSDSHNTGLGNGQNGHHSESTLEDIENCDSVRHEHDNDQPSPNVTGETGGGTPSGQDGGNNGTACNVDRTSDRMGIVVGGDDSRTGNNVAGSDSRMGSSTAGSDSRTGSSTAGSDSRMGSSTAGNDNHTESSTAGNDNHTESSTAGSDSRTGSSTAGNDNHTESSITENGNPTASNVAESDHTGGSVAGENECGSNNDSSVGVSRTEQSSDPTTSGARSPGDGTDGDSVPFAQPEQGHPGPSEIVVSTMQRDSKDKTPL